MARAGLQIAAFIIEQAMRVFDWATGRKALADIGVEEEPTLPGSQPLSHQDVEHQREQMRNATRRQPPPLKR